MPRVIHMKITGQQVREVCQASEAMPAGGPGRRAGRLAGYIGKLARVARGAGIGDIGHGRMRNYSGMGRREEAHVTEKREKGTGSARCAHVEDIGKLMWLAQERCGSRGWLAIATGVKLELLKILWISSVMVTVWAGTRRNNGATRGYLVAERKCEGPSKR